MQQRHVVVIESAAAIGHERIEGAGALRRVPTLAEGKELSKIIGRALLEEFVQDGEVALFRSSIEAAAHRRIVLAGIRSADQIIQRTAAPLRVVEIAARMLLRLDGVEVAPPQIAVSGPLRMQSLHSGLHAPQRHTVDHQLLAIAVEQLVGARAAQPLVNRPDIGGDNVAAERRLE